MTRGIILYHTGRKLAVRLAVCLHTLRKYYSGPVTLLNEGDESRAITEPLCDKHDISLKEVSFEDSGQRGAVFINATLCHLHTPYDTTLWLDVDTLTRGDFWSPMFEAAERSDFAICQISNWTVGGKIAKRLEPWRKLYGDWVDSAKGDGAAINCGLFAFNKRSKLMRDWYKLASPALSDPEICKRYPDETCCQLILHRYNHEIMSHNYNYHCRADRGYIGDAKMIHYCGSKHCRIKENGEYQHYSDIWYKAFDEIRDSIPKKWISWDRQLKQNLEKHDG